MDYNKSEVCGLSHRVSGLVQRLVSGGRPPLSSRQHGPCTRHILSLGASPLSLARCCTVAILLHKKTRRQSNERKQWRISAGYTSTTRASVRHDPDSGERRLHILRLRAPDSDTGWSN